MRRCASPKFQLWTACVLLVACVIGWPISYWVAPGEPKFVLGLSWLALILTQYNTIVTALNYKQTTEAT